MLLFSKKLKRIVVILGLTVTALCVYGAVHFIVDEYLRSLDVDAYILSFNPQTETEFRDAFWKSVDYCTRHYTIFNPDWDNILHMLSHESKDGTGHGTYVSTKKPWVTDKLCRDLKTYAGSAYNGGIYDAEIFKDGRFDNYIKWGNKEKLMRVIISRLTIGIAATGTIAVFLPYLFFGLLFLCVLVGKPMHSNTLETPGTHIEIQQDVGADDELQTTDCIASESHTHSLFTFLLGCTVVLVCMLKRSSAYCTVQTRAPPRCTLRRSLMKRAYLLILVIVCLSFVPAAVMAQTTPTVDSATSQVSTSLYLQFGHWQNAKGSGASLVWEYPRISFFGFSFLNGEAGELLVLAHVIKRSYATLSTGASIGMLNKDDGTDLFEGFEVRGKFFFTGTTDFSYRFASRHNESERFFNMWVLGLNQKIASWKIGLFYEPIRTDQPLDHRFALNVRKTFSRFTIIGECRASTDNTVTANVDLDIPMSF